MVAIISVPLWWTTDNTKIRHLARMNENLDTSIFHRNITTGKWNDKRCVFTRLYFGTEYKYEYLNKEIIPLKIKQLLAENNPLTSPGLEPQTSRSKTWRIRPQDHSVLPGVSQFFVRWNFLINPLSSIRFHSSLRLVPQMWL